MFPVQNTSLTATQLAKFTSRYAQTLTPNLRALAAAYLAGVQEAENAIFAVMEGRFLANAVGVDLDACGDLVGQPRTGLDDPTYRAAIRLRIKANRSQGGSEDIVKIALLAASKLTADGNGKVIYTEAPVYSWSATVANLSYPSILQSVLTEARAATSKGTLIYSNWAPGDDFSFDSTTDAAVGEAGWGSVYSGTTGGLLLGALSV